MPQFRFRDDLPQGRSHSLSVHLILTGRGVSTGSGLGGTGVPSGKWTAITSFASTASARASRRARFPLRLVRSAGRSDLGTGAQRRCRSVHDHRSG